MSMQSKKRRDQRKKAQKKKTPKKGGGLKNLQKNHMDLLQNIEFTLVTAYREDNSVDDSVLRDALREMIYGKPCEDARSQLIVSQLIETREMRMDISDKLWKEAFRTILLSIHNHSSLAPGERGYLNFVSDFIV